MAESAGAVTEAERTRAEYIRQLASGEANADLTPVPVEEIPHICELAGFERPSRQAITSALEKTGARGRPQLPRCPSCGQPVPEGTEILINPLARVQGDIQPVFVETHFDETGMRQRVTLLDANGDFSEGVKRSGILEAKLPPQHEATSKWASRCVANTSQQPPQKVRSARTKKPSKRRKPK